MVPTWEGLLYHFPERGLKHIELDFLLNASICAGLLYHFPERGLKHLQAVGPQLAIQT
jgi:hypothetical protein